MGQHKKVGILTFHKCINYGSYWQARCLVEGLCARGHEVELLDHDCGRVRRAEAKCALQPKLPQRTPSQELPLYRAKARKFADAIAKLPLSAPFSLHRPDTADHYDAIVVGSDEVWNFRHPWYGSKPIFFGDGLKTERLVSYAASFGNHSAGDGIDPAWAAKLSRFTAISVRDKNSQRLVQESIKHQPPLVLDPCLQFPEVVRAPAQLVRAPYAIVYGHLFPRWLSDAVRSWARRSGTRLISVGYSNDWADAHNVSASPREFARMMSGAAAVVTNFFHGCVFAILNGKPWVTAPSDYRSIKIPDLVAMLGAEHRIVSEQTDAKVVHELLQEPVHESVAARLKARREQSQAYLDASLS